LDYISAAANSVIQQDRLETMAIKEDFQESAYKIPISSIKSMIGETLSAAALFQVASSIGAMVRDFIPPTINYSEPDPECDLDYIPNRARKTEVRSVLINNFGPGGNNAAAVIEKYEG